MDFTIPKSAEEPLRHFLSLTREQAECLITAISTTKPTLLVQDFATEVAEKCGAIPVRIEPLLSMFSGMYLARIEIGKPLSEFVRGISSALSEHDDPALIPKDKVQFEQHLNSILSAEDSLGVTAKALDLVGDQEHGCHSVRILTDVRHVFSDDPTQKPKAAVIYHTLNLVFHEVSGFKELYIALDHADLQRLKLAIERAESKEATLQTVLESAGVKCLN